MTRRLIGILALLAFAAPGRAADEPPQWVVVTAPAFRDALEPLCEHRKAQGMNVVVVRTDDVLSAKEALAGDAARLRDHVHQLCRRTKGPSYVLLVGAVEAGELTDAAKKVLPPLRGTVGRMKGQPSDNGYGLPGDDLLPAVAVGRMPARSEDEVRAMVRKTLEHERDDRPGPWRRRLTVLAGVPDYNPLVDKLVESLALARFEQLDPSWSGRAIYHNQQSRFCLPDADLHGRARDYVQDGQAFTLYLGHSNAEGFWAGGARYLGRDDWGRLKIGRGKGVFVTFGCNGCQLSGPDGEGYGVAAVRNPDGPAAVVGSHGICFAAMVELAAQGLFEGGFGGELPDRLGDLWRKVQHGVARGKINDLTYKLLDAVDGDAKIPQATQRLEHLEMFLLLGDPALRLPQVAADLRLTCGEAVAGKALTVKGEVPGRLEGAKVRLTVERPAGSEPADLEPLPKEPADARARVMRDNHDRANRFVLGSKEVTAKDGRFEASLELPAKLPWPRLVVRAYAATERHEGLGVVKVAPPAPPK